MRARNPLDPRCADSSGACKPSKYGCGRGQEYEYDVENRLVRVRRDTDNAVGVEGPGGTPIAEQNVQMEIVYDAMGRRVETIEYVDAATGQVMDGQNGNPPPRRIRHVYFGLEVIQEYACADNWPCGSTLPLAREFLWGDPERYPEPVTIIRHRFDPLVIETYHYLHDVLGSVVGLVNEAGTLVERNTYDPYGKPLIEKWDAQTSTWQASAEPASGLPYSPTGNPFLWTGHRYDPAVGLYHTLYRTYSPTVGRWLQRDPIEYAGGSLNLYEYVRSSPIALIDPLGLAPPKTVGLWAALQGICKNECNARCKKDSVSSQPSSAPTTSCTAEESEADCNEKCMKACRKEAAKILKGLRDQLKRCQAQGGRPDGLVANCTVWSSRLRWLFDRMGLEYFDYDTIQMIKVEPKFGHVVVGLRGSNSTAQVDGNKIWEVIIDMTNWNRNNRGGLEYAFEGGTGVVDGQGDTHKDGSFRPYGPPIGKQPGEDTDEGPFPDRFPK